MSIINDNSSSRISIPFPDEKYQFYSKKYGINTVGKLSNPHVSEFFIQIYKDFKKGDVSLDIFSELCGIIWTNNFSKIETFHANEVADILLEASELNYYVRNLSNQSSCRFFLRVMRNIDMYCKKNHTYD